MQTFEINLELAKTNVDKLMMKLVAYLRAKNIFLVLNNMWTTFDIEKLGNVLTMTERENSYSLLSIEIRLKK